MLPDHLIGVYDVAPTLGHLLDDLFELDIVVGMKRATVGPAHVRGRHPAVDEFGLGTVVCPQVSQLRLR